MAGVVSAAIVGSAVVGAIASSKAAKTQSKAADKAADVSQAQYEQTREDQMPFLEAGYGALNRLNEYLGIPDKSFANFNAGAYLNANPDAKAWVDSQMLPLANLPKGLALRGKNPEQLAYEHFVADGSRRTGDFFKNTLSPNYGKYARDFSMQDFQIDPGYAFRMSEGLKSLDRQAAARGGLISGGALKAAQRYGQDMGSQEYQNAFNRYQVNRANQLNPLQSITGAGQTATNQLASAAGNYGANAGNAALIGGANQANAYLTKGNIAASQYGTYGKALDEALNTDWSSVGNKIKGFFE